MGVPDPDTDIDETLGALSDLVRAGKIRSFGASKVPASQIVEAQWTADRRGHGRFRTEQPPYSLLTRAIEYDVLPTCLRHGMGVMAYSPLAGGWLSGKYRKGQEVSGPGSAARARRFPGPMTPANPANAAKLDAADALGALADEAGLTLIQMAIAFVTRHPAVTSAIIGPRTMEHLDSYLAADGIDLPGDVLDRIDEIVPPGVTINVADNMWNSARRRWAPHSAAGSATSQGIGHFRHGSLSPVTATWPTLPQPAGVRAQAEDLAREFAGALDELSWYVDFRPPAETFVVFPAGVPLSARERVRSGRGLGARPPVRDPGTAARLADVTSGRFRGNA